MKPIKRSKSYLFSFCPCLYETAALTFSSVAETITEFPKVKKNNCLREGTVFAVAPSRQVGALVTLQP